MGFLIAIAYTVQVVHQDGKFISRDTDCDHVMKTKMKFVYNVSFALRRMSYAKIGLSISMMGK